MGDVFYLYAVDLDSVLIDGVSDQGIDPGNQIIRPEVDGQVDPRAIFTGTTDPVIDIQTQSIAAALAKITYDGLLLIAANDATLFCQKAEHGGTRGGALKHLKLEVKAGVVIPVSVSASVETPATLAFRIVAADDLTNDPFVFTALQSLAGTPNAVEEFFAGPVKLNNVALEGVQDIAVEFGISLRMRRAAGIAAPVHLSIRRRVSGIRITTDDAKVASDFVNAVAIATATHVYLRKGSVGGRVAEATAEHVKFTVAAGAIVCESIAGADQMGVISILPIWDGTNAAIAIDTAAAIA